MTAPEWRQDMGRWTLEGEEGFTAHLDSCSDFEGRAVWEWEVVDWSGCLVDGSAETFEQGQEDATNALHNAEEWARVNGDRT